MSSVFISYSWSQSDYADEIETALSPIADVKRDKNDVPVWGSFSNFMKSIRKEDFAVLLISDEYLRSVNCMYEVSQLFRDENWYEHTMYVVFDNASKIYHTENHCEYIDYWVKKRDLLENKSKTLPPQSTMGYVQEINQICEVLNMVGEFLKLVRYTKNPKPYNAIEKMKSRISSTIVSSTSPFMSNSADQKENIEFLNSKTPFTHISVLQNAEIKGEKVIMNGFKWIQLSDLHLCAKPFEVANVRQQLVEFIKEKQFDCDYVFITGDIADMGNYTGVVAFMKELLVAINIPNKANVFWCVGNNDIKCGLKMRNKFIDEIRNSSDRYAEFNLAIEDEESYGILMEIGMKSYIDAYKSILGRPLSVDDISNACSYHDLGKCNLVVLNTCITSCDDRDEGQLMLIKNRLEETLGKITDKRKPLIVMGHHGMKFMYDDHGTNSSFIKICETAGVDLYLCGHAHELGHTSFNDVGCDVHQITSGIGTTTAGLDIFSFMLGEYNEDDNTVRITPYSYSNNSFYVDYGSHMGIDDSYVIELGRFAKNTSIFTVTTNPFYNAIKKYHENNSRVKFIRDVTEINQKSKAVFLTKLKMDDDESTITFLDAIYKLSQDNSVNPLFIYGDGGAGKTFMLIKGVQEINETSGRHVLYVPLNNLRFETETRNEKAIENYLQTWVFNGVNLDWKEYYGIANGEEILLFLDGFNEVALTGNRRAAIANEIEDLSNSLNCKIVIASRYESILAARIKFGKKAKIMELTNAEVRGYLRKIKPKLSLIGNSPLLSLLKNPLMLNLYGQTTLAQENRTPDYDRDCKLCSWVEFDNFDKVEISHVLWNYLNREVLKAESDEEKILAWLSVHIFWPRVACYIQSNDSFDINGDELDKQIKEGLVWLNKNIFSHKELVFLCKIVETENYDIDIRDYVLSLQFKDVRSYMQVKQAFFAGQKRNQSNGQDSYTFLHQSIRDCLAAIHLLNVIPSELELFSVEWSKKGVFKSCYVFNHFINFAKIKKFSNVKMAVELLRGIDIPESNYVLDNLFTVFLCPELYKGDLTEFDFSGLDLFNCDLTEAILSRGEIEANLSEARRIGDNTFIKPAHKKAVHSIAVSKNCSIIVSCGDDKVLLWRYNDRQVDRVLYRYPVGAKNNRCCFSASEKNILFSDENVLMIYNLDTHKVERQLRAKGKIQFLSSSFENGQCFYYITDTYGTNYCWLEISPDTSNNSTAEYICYSYKNQWIHHTASYGLLLRYQDRSNYLELINKDRQIVQRYSVEDLGCPETIAFAEDAKLCAFAYKFSNGLYKVVIIDMSESGSIDDFFIYSAVGGLAFASSGRWLSILGHRGYQYNIINYQKKKGVFGYSELSKSETVRPISLLSLTLCESFIFYGTMDGKIIVDELGRNDFRYYVYTTLDNHPPFVTNIAIIPGTERCVASYEDGVLREWDYKSGLIERTYERNHIGPVSCVAVANEKKLLASGGADGRVLLWDREESSSFAKVIGDISSQYRDTFEIAQYRISSITFSSNDKYIIASCVAGDIFIWNIENVNDDISGEFTEPIIIFERFNISAHIHIYKVQNEERVLISDYDGSLLFGKIDYIEKKVIVNKFHRNLHGNRIESACLTSSLFGDLVATFGADHAINLWNADTGEFIREIYKSRDTGTICFSPDGLQLYYSCRYDGFTHIMRIDLSKSEHEISEFHSIHASGSYSRILTIDNMVLTAAKDGFIQVCDSNGSELHKLEIPRTNIDEFKTLSAEIMYVLFITPSQFIDMNEAPISGKFKEWLIKGELVNVFSLLRLNKSTFAELPYKELFGSTLGECVDVLERVRILTRSIISCTVNRSSDILAGEYELLESLLIYVYYEASVDEQNLAIILELLLGEQTGELPLVNLFVNLDESHKSYSALRSFQNYYFMGNNEKILAVNSLIKRFHPLICIHYEFLPIIPMQDISALAMSMVMNFNNKWIYPDAFDCISKAQGIYLEMIWHYLNNLPSEERRRKKLHNLLNGVINDTLKIFYDIPDISDWGYIENLLNLFRKTVDESNYKELEVANRRILDFYKEI